MSMNTQFKHRYKDCGDLILKITEKNLASMESLMILKDHIAKVNPKEGFDKFYKLIKTVDKSGFKGSTIYDIYKNVCSMNVSKFLSVLVSLHLDILSVDQIKVFLEEDSYPDFDVLYYELRKRKLDLDIK